jgi:hypothetical protein
LCARAAARLRSRALFALAFRVAIAAVLGVAAVLKAARPRKSGAALAGLGVAGGGTALVLGLAALELVLATGVALGSAAAAYAASGLLAVFAVGLALTIRAGRSGAPCPCFGSRGRVGWPSVARNVTLAAGFAAVPWVPRLDDTALMAIGLAVALSGVAVLGVVVLALARELGELRLRLPPDVALELASEGPEIGERTRLIERFALAPTTRFALAVFSSPGCRLCQALSPGIASLRRDPLVAVEVFDEERDRDAWAELAVPGSPYAVALDPDGTVRAKGTFNSLAQLESIVAAAERRTAALRT